MHRPWKTTGRALPRVLWPVTEVASAELSLSYLRFAHIVCLHLRGHITPRAPVDSAARSGLSTVLLDMGSVELHCAAGRFEAPLHITERERPRGDEFTLQLASMHVDGRASPSVLTLTVAHGLRPGRQYEVQGVLYFEVD